MSWAGTVRRLTLRPAENKGHLQQLLQSITHYIATDSQAPEQRFGFIALNKLLSLWVEPIQPAPASTAGGSKANGSTTPTGPSPVPGFEQYLYSNAVKLCFEVPLQRSFDFADAQSFQVSARGVVVFARAPADGLPHCSSAPRSLAKWPTFSKVCN